MFIKCSGAINRPAVCPRPLILHSAEEDNLSPFNPKIACLCQSIEINNNKYVYMHVCMCVLPHCMMTRANRKIDTLQPVARYFHCYTMWYPLSTEILYSHKSLNAPAIYTPMYHSYQNGNMHISVLNCALWDMGRVCFGTCEIGIFSLHTEAHFIKRLNHLRWIYLLILRRTAKFIISILLMFSLSAWPQCYGTTDE